MKLTKNEKGQIQESLKQYVSKYPSQNKAAQSLTLLSIVRYKSRQKAKQHSSDRNRQPIPLTALSELLLDVRLKRLTA